jgi:lysophospholipase L1-like esterase
MRRWLSFLACLSMAVPVSVSHAQVGPIRVACVGNSITYGGLGDLSYPQQLGKLLGNHYDVRNYGQSGTTMLRKGDSPYWNGASFPEVRDFSPHILIISLGTNDSKPGNWVYGDEFFSDYMDFVGTFRDSTHHPQIFVCFPPPAFVAAYGITDSIIHGQIIPFIDSVRVSAKTLSIDFYHSMLDKGGLFPDGIHPDADGYAVMARIVFDAIANSPAGFSRYFAASSLTFEKGDPVTLHWETTRGSQVTLNGVAARESDSTIVFPAGTAQYTLIARGPLFSDTSRVTLRYIPSGTIQSFAVAPAALERGAGDSCLLSWSTTKGTSATLDGVPVDPNSERRVAPSSTRTYTLAASGDVSDTGRVTVQVLEPDQINRALHRPVTASSTEEGYPPESAVDGDRRTAWRSTAASAQSFSIDLGRPRDITRVVLNWGSTFASGYHLQVMDSAGIITTLFSRTAGKGGVEDLGGLSGSGQYLSLTCSGKDLADSGYVLNEFEVYTRSQPVVGVGTVPAAPAVYSIDQNFPNPFNPVTTIRFTLAFRSLVRIEVFDQLGRMVAELLKAELNAGSHAVRWNADASSGVYFVRMNAVAVHQPAAHFSGTRAMLLVR